MKMFPGLLFVLVPLLGLKLAEAAEPMLCHCPIICERAFLAADNFSPEANAGCQSGCRWYSSILKISWKTGLTVMSDEKTIIASCKHYCIKKNSNFRRDNGCDIGCENGCELLGKYQPRVKLTYSVEDGIINNGPDSTDIETVLTDPGLRLQLEASEKARIPATYFTKLPVHHEQKHYCGNESHVLCEGWMTNEPLICACLLLMMGLILMTVYRQRGEVFLKTEIADTAPAPAPALPEKTPLQQAV